MSLVVNDYGGIKGFVPDERDPVMIRRAFQALWKRIEMLERFVYNDRIVFEDGFRLILEDTPQGSFENLLSEE